MGVILRNDPEDSGENLLTKKGLSKLKAVLEHVTSNEKHVDYCALGYCVN